MIEHLEFRFGLKSEVIEKINSVFSKYPNIEQVVVYGSRAKGNYRLGSDIDLTLIGTDLSYQQLLQIATDIDDLLLPYKVDLSIYKQINNPDLVEHINRIGQQFYIQNK